MKLLVRENSGLEPDYSHVLIDTFDVLTLVSRNRRAVRAALELPGDFLSLTLRLNKGLAGLVPATLAFALAGDGDVDCFAITPEVAASLAPKAVQVELAVTRSDVYLSWWDDEIEASIDSCGVPWSSLLGCDNPLRHPILRDDSQRGDKPNDPR